MHCFAIGIRETDAEDAAEISQKIVQNGQESTSSRFLADVGGEFISSQRPVIKGCERIGDHESDNTTGPKLLGGAVSEHNVRGVNQ